MPAAREADLQCFRVDQPVHGGGDVAYERFWLTSVSFSRAIVWPGASSR
jgi:hypothetical protein